MDAAWIGVIGTLSGVLAAGGIALISKRLELQAESRKHRRETRIEKLETLFVELGSFATYVMERTVDLIDAQNNDDRVAIIKIVADVPTSIHFRSIDLLPKVALYARELKGSVNVVADDIGLLIEMTHRFMDTQMKPIDATDQTEVSTDDITSATDKLSQDCLSLQSELGEKITSLIDER